VGIPGREVIGMGILTAVDLSGLPASTRSIFAKLASREKKILRQNADFAKFLKKIEKSSKK